MDLLLYSLTLLFVVQAGKQNSTLKPLVLEEIVESHRQQICNLISHEKQYPQDHVQFYDKYVDLISKQVRLSSRFSAYFIQSALL